MSYDRYDLAAYADEIEAERHAPPPPVCQICGCDIEGGVLCVYDSALLAAEAQTVEAPAITAETVFSTIGDGAVR